MKNSIWTLFEHFEHFEHWQALNSHEGERRASVFYFPQKAIGIIPMGKWITAAYFALCMW